MKHTRKSVMKGIGQRVETKLRDPLSATYVQTENPRIMKILKNYVTRSLSNVAPLGGIETLYHFFRE